MGHPGNWHRNPRKMALEIERQREREAAETATSREVAFYAISKGADVYALHPCTTHLNEWVTEATCFGCRQVRCIDLKPFLKSPWAHAPWVRIMPTLVCSNCGERPEEIAFWDKGVSGVDRHFMGKLTVVKPTDDELAALSPKKRKVWATRTFTPDELVWRRPGAAGRRKP